MIQKKNAFLTAIKMVALLILLFNWIFSLTVFTELPEKIPVHFDASGEPDRLGHKSMYFVLPALATFLFILMTSIHRYPRFFEYAKSVTGENENSGYASSNLLLHVLKTGVMIVLASIQVLTYTTVTQRSAGLGSWFLPLTLAIILLPVAGFLIRAKLKK